MFSCCKKQKERIIIQFYKNSKEGLIKQLNIYLDDAYNTYGQICGNYTDSDYEYFIYENRDIFLRVDVKCKIIENKLNHKMIIYEINKN